MKHHLKENQMELGEGCTMIQNARTKVQHDLEFENVKACISTMFDLSKMNGKPRKNKLFMDECQPIYLIVKSVRMPFFGGNHYKFSLPHSLFDKSSEVCLIVCNLSGKKEDDNELTVEHYKRILEVKKVEGISKIIPLRQLLAEYDTYPCKRRFVQQFDLFLVDPRICGLVRRFFGKEMWNRQKLPVPVSLRVEDLQAEIDMAFSKTVHKIDIKGPISCLKVGLTRHSVQQIAENIMAVAEGLSEQFPGGWKNIRSLGINIEHSVRIPVYLSLIPTNEVDAPISLSKIPAAAVVYEDELSTRLGTRVAVLPSGDVIVGKVEDSEDSSDMEDNDSDEMTEATSDEENEKTGADGDDTATAAAYGDKGDNYDSDDNEHITDAAEYAYLHQWSEEWNEKAINNNKKRKEKMMAEATSDEENEETGADGDDTATAADDDDKGDNYDSDENEHVTEAAENAYLHQWSVEWNEKAINNNKKRKEKMDDCDHNEPQKIKKIKSKTSQNETKKQKKPKGAKHLEMEGNPAEIVPYVKSKEQKEKRKKRKVAGQKNRGLAKYSKT